MSHERNQELLEENTPKEDLPWGIDRRKFYRIALICFLAAILVGAVVGSAVSLSLP
jgi:hypothetical protein